MCPSMLSRAQHRTQGSELGLSTVQVLRKAYNQELGVECIHVLIHLGKGALRLRKGAECEALRA